MDPIREGVQLFREDGLISFIKGVIRYLRRQIILFQGVMTLSVDNTSAQFVANSYDVIAENHSLLQEEEHELISILTELSEDDIFYDIGANVGVYSCFVVNKFDSCQVVAFEPYPPNVQELKENAELNYPERISILQLALSNKTGTESFSIPEEPTPAYGTGSITDHKSGESVRTVQGDKLISTDGVQPPNIVKIDVEGAEPLVLDGLRDALSNDDCRLVFCELHPSDLPEYGYNVSKMVDEFEQMGYEVRLHQRWDIAYTLEARRE